GTYSGDFTPDLTGTQGNEIKVRAYPGEHVIIDGTWHESTSAADVWYWGLHVSNIAFASQVSAYITNGTRTRFINGVITNSSGNGASIFDPAVGSEIYGTVIQFCGAIGANGQPAHSIYAQNASASVSKLIKDNIIVDGYGAGVHAYTSSGSISRLNVV